MRKEAGKIFDNMRYITMGVKNEIPLDLILFMWNCIDKLKEQAKELDYLQVFELKAMRADDVFYQEIEHRQEIPDYSKTYLVLTEKMVSSRKIFIIDQGAYSIAMLADEY